MATVEETAECRRCKRKLKGRPYYTGNLYAVVPGTMQEARINYYGGFVCSRECDYYACLDLERTMPGHSLSKTTITSQARAKVEQNWR
jgi:hypothetical protein